MSDTPINELPPRKKRRFRWRTIVLIQVIDLFILVAVLYFVAARRPSWYRPAAVDHVRLRGDKAAIAALQEQISAGLNAGREVRFELAEDQLNRWLAARAEIWPDFIVTSESLDLPQVAMTPDGVHVGVTGQRGGLEVVLEITASFAVTPERLTVTYEAASVGALPIPKSWVAKSIGRALADAGAGDVVQNGTLSVENRWVWPNGKREFRIRELRCGAGSVEIVLDPLPAARR